MTKRKRKSAPKKRKKKAAPKRKSKAKARRKPRKTKLPKPMEGGRADDIDAQAMARVHVAHARKFVEQVALQAGALSSLLAEFEQPAKPAFWKDHGTPLIVAAGLLETAENMSLHLGHAYRYAGSSDLASMPRPTN